MATNYSKFLELQAGSARTVDLSNNSNILTLGGGGLQFNGSTSGLVVIAAAATTSTYSLILPPAQAASSGYTLSNDGTGVLSWVASSSGSVTAVSVSTANGFAGSSSGGSTPALTLSTTITGVLKGNGTAISAATAGTDYVIPSGSITGTAGNVTTTSNATLTTLSALTTASSLATVGTITSGTWNGSTIGYAYGGTDATSQASAQVNMSPMTTAGDLTYENSTPAPDRLPIGSTGQVLTVVAGLPAWENPATGGTVTSVSVVSTNGFAGTVATATSTPAITIETTITGILQGDGTAISAASTTGTGSTVVLSASPTLTGTLSAAAASFSSAINMNSNQINDLASPSVSTDAANKGYVDAAINGLTWKGPVEAYADSNVPLTGGATLTIDGYSVQNGDLVILGNQTTASQNGEYTASGIGTAYTLTANGQPTAAGDAWLVLNGTVYANSAFVATAAVPAAEFVEFAGPTSLIFSAPLVLTGNTVTINQATTSTNGYLSSTDWNTFNNKQPAGSYITALTGDATASGPGSAALTLATVNSNTGSFGSSTSIPSFTVNAKGLITAASGNAVVAPAGTLSGTTLNSTVVSSSLTSVGTIATGVWQGTAIGPTFGGTGETTYATGDTLYASATNVLSKLTIGSTGNVLTVAGGVPTWAAPATSGTVTSVSVVSTNGFAGTVATATSTPAITIETTVTGILQGNGTAISAATTTGSGDVVLAGSPTLTGTVTAANATLSGNLGITTVQISAVYGGVATLSANTTYALRYGLPANSETAGKLYVADWSTSSFDLFWCVGLYNSTSTTATGATISATSNGLFTLGSSDSTFGSTDQGKPVWLGSAGAITANSAFSPSAGDANEKIGIVTGATTVFVDCQMMGVS